MGPISDLYIVALCWVFGAIFATFVIRIIKIPKPEKKWIDDVTIVGIGLPTGIMFLLGGFYLIHFGMG